MKLYINVIVLIIIVHLNSSSKSNNQWFLNDVVFPGAVKQEFIPQIEDKFAVLASYHCAKNFSESVPVFITGLKEFALSYNFVSLPNPFIGECKIKYSLPNTANTKLQVYDISGTHLIDLETGQKNQGDYEYSFIPSKYKLSARSYILKHSVNDNIGTIKLVSLK